VLNGVLQGQDTSLGLCLITNVRILLVHADHNSWVLGATNDGWEDGSGSIISGETSLAHTRAVVNDQCLDLIICLQSAKDQSHVQDEHSRKKERRQGGYNSAAEPEPMQ
jgi:hypothetical protein